MVPLLPCMRRSRAISVYTHKLLQMLDQANVHALREHDGPRAGCRVSINQVRQHLSLLCAEHVRQLGGESPLLNLMEVKS